MLLMLFRTSRIKDILSGYPISKFDLLCKVNKLYNLYLRITKDSSIVISRILDDRLFRSITLYPKTNWDNMLYAMHNEDKSLWTVE